MYEEIFKPSTYYANKITDVTNTRLSYKTVLCEYKALFK